MALKPTLGLAKEVMSTNGVSPTIYFFQKLLCNYCDCHFNPKSRHKINLVLYTSIFMEVMYSYQL